MDSDRQINQQYRFSWKLFVNSSLMYLLLTVPVLVLPHKIVSANSTLTREAIAQSPLLSKNIIYVNPKSGDDSQSGKKLSPLKTITQALKMAEAGTTIQLAAGTYSEATGETFPLIIDNGITLKGNSQNQGYDTIIQGNGYFVSPTGAGQNVAIAALEDAGGIIGVRVTNDHTRGHGLWIESASPEVVSNTFTRNGNTGLSVNGNSSPRIENNYFYNNLGNGLLVYGTSQPEVVNNTFEQTGFGVSAVQQAAPILTENTFKGNRIGIIFEGDSQGILRDNEIINSSEAGLTAIARSRVDLGTDDEPGNNIFRSNYKLDIQNATSEEIPAVGTEVQGEVVGEVNFDRGTFVATNNNSSNNSLRDLSPLPSKTSLDARPLPKLDPPAPTPTEPDPSLPSPPPASTNNTDRKEFVFTPPSSPVATDVEPVPFPPEASSSTLSSSSSQISSLSDVLGSRASQVKYKVLVEALNEDEEEEVRSLYPEAFKTIYQGESWLQVGAFSNWDKAKQAEQTLVNLGLETYLLE